MIMPDAREGGQAVEILCRDGVRLGGHLWLTTDNTPIGTVIINAATGVLARYYHRYARFLSAHGFDVLTYDYRGIGQSRPARLQGCGYRWRDWGQKDFDAVLRFMHAHKREGSLLIVGHSIGGFLPGLAESNGMIDRILTVGAQYAWWGDYAPRQRLRLFCKFHVIMPALTFACGYFPGRRLGWLEDLPAGVANEWSFRGPNFERSYPVNLRQDARMRPKTVTAPILAVTISDDEFGTLPAIRRTLRYYQNAERIIIQLKPADYNRQTLGHFNLFNDSHKEGFWVDTLSWLREGHNPWPDNIVAL